MKHIAIVGAYALVAVLTIVSSMVWMLWPIIGYDDD